MLNTFLLRPVFLVLSCLLLPGPSLSLGQEEETPDFKHQLTLPDDPLLSTEQPAENGDVRWAKFVIVLSEPDTVYFQNSSKYLFHYDFAVAHLPQFQGMTRAEFDAVSLHTENQQVLLGTVLVPGDRLAGEYGVQFVGLDPYPKESVLGWIKLVAERVIAEANLKVFYVPSFEQDAAAESGRDYLESNGIELTSVDRWLTGDQCYSVGWALGAVRWIPAAEISAAYADGRLGAGDILLTDAVPAEVPFVAGIITLSPSTPNSHVAIQAATFGIPFAYPAGEADRAAIAALADREIILRVSKLHGRCEIRVLDVHQTLTDTMRSEILRLKKPRALAIPAKARFGALSAETSTLQPTDAKYFGGKASNFGLLRRTIPENSPAAIAFSFDLWDGFMRQFLPTGKRLRREIRERLEPFTYPPDIPALRTALGQVRELIKNSDFSNEERAAIIAALGVFDPNAPIRFRSSTNVEDSADFTGAGLYDSYSGCLADDLDGDDLGPSHCDLDEPEERGVFRAMRKVYASFYNENAVLERLRHRVNERQVGMALLVHHSFPDEIERANGVATVRVPNTAEPEMTMKLVTQEGAVSVANPDTSAHPEVVRVNRSSFGSYLTLEQRSSLVPLGAYVLEWQSDYEALAKLLKKVTTGYRQTFPAQTRLLLDFEYKKDLSGMVVKQLRPIPWPIGTEGRQFLVSAPEQFCVYQGETGDVFSNHRLKGLWQFGTRTMALTEESILRPFYSRVTAELVAEGGTFLLDGPLAEQPGGTHSVTAEKIVDRWTKGEGPAQQRFALVTRTDDHRRHAIVTIADWNLSVHADYAQAQPVLPSDGIGPGESAHETTRHSVTLVPCFTLEPSIPVAREIAAENGVAIRTEFYWPAPPSGFTAGYTAPLAAWIGTRIDGLTSQPLVLRGYFSQTYRPGHHNFSEEFIFEPRLEPGLTAEQLEELSAANVQLIHVRYDGESGIAKITVLGLDGEFRELP